MEPVRIKLGSGSLPRFLGDIGVLPLPIRLLPEGRKRPVWQDPMSRRYQGDPNPSRIRIPERSEEYVFGADFLSESPFFVLASSWKCPSELTSPAVVFWVNRENGKSESFPLLESARIAIRIGVAASAPASQSGEASPPNSIAARRPPVVFGGLGHITRRVQDKTPIRRAYGSRRF